MWHIHRDGTQGLDAETPSDSVRWTFLCKPEGKDRPAPAADGRGAGRQSDYLIDPIAFLKSTFSVFSNLPETCLLEQVLELIMNEKPPNSARLFLNEDADKPSLPERGDLRRRLRRAMERRASSMKGEDELHQQGQRQRFPQEEPYPVHRGRAVALGVILGFTLRPHNLSLREIRYFAFPGEATNENAGAAADANEHGRHLILLLTVYVYKRVQPGKYFGL
ncbi:hypothetical protein L3Q82_003314 [Scortum barcoo]|uniref:Uncharacterized protein n=1 Tax=Scortum barcoo TaxID=214431 RepID=A0ACB8VMM2_9TELE|nr:hypothetical protein L3Q82_003314 [Scortum barcoo]